MRTRSAVAAVILAFAMFLALASVAGAKSGGSKDSPTPAPAASATSPTQDENLHLEGEKRFRSNCARCHAAPPRFAPRMMTTIVRHMRVRANITNDDMRLILRYMTE